VFMDAMEQAIADQTESYRRIAFKNVFTFIVLFAIAVAFLLLSTFFYSFKIKQGLSLFTNFFREAADSNVKINDENLVFREFEDLSHLANRMVDERTKSEILLHRDELRLDTLLRLGMMEKYSLQEKYDFILKRIVQITRSEEGYLALVNSAQSHITICSFIVFNENDAKEREGELLQPMSVEDGGLPGKAVMKRTAIIVNSQQGEKIYPYKTTIKRHLDVPIFNDGKIVVVAGVSNNNEKYDNSDIRQMTMLLEGMWLHVLNKCAEEELAQLERQIIAISEDERSRIGRDLHDDLGSHLTGVELLSKVLQRQLQDEAPKREKQLGIIRNLIRDAIEKTRRLSHGLYPVHVIEYGLEAAIEELVVEVEKIFKVHFDLLWEGGTSGKDLGKHTATHLHYIIREAVFNAARHGKPTKIGVYMRLSDEGFSLKIVDNGTGFDGTPAATGMGFHTMKYRAKAIGAELTISSGKEGGTVISVSGEGLE
jgi:signal transduction histidine kinase